MERARALPKDSVQNSMQYENTELRGFSWVPTFRYSVATIGQVMLHGAQQSQRLRKQVLRNRPNWLNIRASRLGL
jgi:hypothetical protein